MQTSEPRSVPKLSDEERDFMRLVFEETGGIPWNPVALTELPVVAEALRTRGFIKSGLKPWGKCAPKML